MSMKPGAQTSAERVAELVGAYLEAIGSRASLEGFLAPEATLEVAGVEGTLRGAAVVARAQRHHFDVEFDARPEVVRLIADGSGAAAEILFVGTHTGEYAGLAPTGRPVRVSLAYFFDVAPEGISAIRIHYDLEQVLAQLRP